MVPNLGSNQIRTRLIKVLLFTVAFFFLLINCEQLEEPPKTLSNCRENLEIDNLEEHLSVTALLDSANMWYAQSNYDCALPYFRKALNKYKNQQWAKEDTTIWPSYFLAIKRTAYILTIKDSIEATRSLLNQAISSGIKHLGANHSDIAYLYNDLAICALRQNKSQKALAIALQADSLLRQTQINDSTIFSRINSILGLIYQQKGYFNNALDHLLKSLKILQKIDDADSLKVAANYHNLASIYDEKGDYKRALNYYQQSLKLKKRRFGEGHISVINTYQNIGVTLDLKGDIDQSLAYYQKALDLMDKYAINNNRLKAKLYHNIAIIYKDKGNYQAALNYHQLALTMKTGRDNITNSYIGIANVYFQMGDYNQAEKYYFKTQKNLEDSSDTPNYPLLAIAHQEFGKFYLHTDSLKHAAQHFQTAIDLQKSYLGERHPLLAESYVRMAEIAGKQENVSAALDSISAAFMANNIENIQNPVPFLSRKAMSRKILLETFYRMGIILSENASKNDDIHLMKKAILPLRKAVALIEEIYHDYRQEGSRLFLREKSQKIFEAAIHCALNLYKDSSNKKYAEEAFQLMERGKASLLRQSFQDSQAKHFAGIADSLLQQEDDIKIDLAYYETELQKEQRKAHPDEKKLRDFQAKQFDLKQSYDALIAELEEKNPAYFQLKHRKDELSLADLQSTLPSHSVLVSYFEAEKHLIIATVTAKRLLVRSVAKPLEFDKSVATFIKSLRTEFHQRAYLKHGQELYQCLIAPIEDVLAAHKGVIFIPDGVLHYIPFEALIDPALLTSTPENEIAFSKLPYLIKNFDISYHYSAALYRQTLLSGKEKTVSNKGFIGFAPIIWPESEGEKDQLMASAEIQPDNIRSAYRQSHFPLPFTRLEIDSIAFAFRARGHQAKTLFFDKASEGAFKRSTGNFRYVHLSTHSKADANLPALSNVAFFPSPDSLSVLSDQSETKQNHQKQDDGFLYSAETYNLDLNADLLVLSGCESGLGKLTRGEGLMSLTRGFLYAGANNIVVSLWKVYDKETSALMINFYREVLKERSYSTALRQAKLKLLENEDTAFPSYWSGFVLIGN